MLRTILLLIALSVALSFHFHLSNRIVRKNNNDIIRNRATFSDSFNNNWEDNPNLQNKLELETGKI